jgi:hypothetical protein
VNILNKILFLTIWLFLSLSSRAWAVDYTQNANCTAAWLFLEGTGTTVNDSSANNYNGTFKGTGEPAWASMSGTGAPTYASYLVNFDGSDDVISEILPLTFNTGTSTTFWVAVSDTGGHQGFMDWGANGEQGAYFHYNAGALSLYAIPSAWASGALGIVVSGVDDGRWTHIAFTFSGHAGNIIGYLNGVATSPVQYFTTGDFNLVDVGEYPTLGGTRFSGNLAETSFFSDVLTSTEINDIMDNGLVGATAGVTAPRSKVLFF